MNQNQKLLSWSNPSRITFKNRISCFHLFHYLDTSSYQRMSTYLYLVSCSIIMAKIDSMGWKCTICRLQVWYVCTELLYWYSTSYVYLILHYYVWYRSKYKSDWITIKQKTGKKLFADVYEVFLNLLVRVIDWIGICEEPSSKNNLIDPLFTLKSHNWYKTVIINYLAKSNCVVFIIVWFSCSFMYIE